MKRALALLTALVLVAVTAQAWAANTSSALRLRTIGEVRLSVDATSATVDELDPGTSASQRDAVIACTVSGQAVVALVRIHQATNGVFVDVLLDSSNTTVSSRLASMNLSGRSHPAPTSNAIDTAIMTAAAGD